MAQTFEEGNKSPHSSLWKEMPSSGEGGAEDTVWRGGLRQPGQPTASGPAAPPPPQPRPPRPPAPPRGQEPGVRGRPPLEVRWEGEERGRGEKPEAGLAEGLTGSSTTLA